MGTLKLRQLATLLRIAGNIISFILITESAKQSVKGFKEIGR